MVKNNLRNYRKIFHRWLGKRLDTKFRQQLQQSMRLMRQTMREKTIADILNLLHNNSGIAVRLFCSTHCHLHIAAGWNLFLLLVDASMEGD